jgi:hypothetical protein
VLEGTLSYIADSFWPPKYLNLKLECLFVPSFVVGEADYLRQLRCLFFLIGDFDVLFPGRTVSHKSHYKKMVSFECRIYPAVLLNICTN